MDNFYLPKHRTHKSGLLKLAFFDFFLTKITTNDLSPNRDPSQVGLFMRSFKTYLINSHFPFSTLTKIIAVACKFHIISLK